MITPHPPPIPRSAFASRLTRGCVAASWLATASLVGLVWWQYQSRVIHPPGHLFVLVAALAIIAAAVALACGLLQVVRGPKRALGAAHAIAGVTPPLALSGVVLVGLAQANAGIITPTPVFVIAVGSATALAEAVLPWTYPKRLATARLVMLFDDRVTDPQGDLDAMDAHVARMEDETGLRLRSPIHWVRGSLLGKQAMALPGLALGSAESPAGALDKHELAHVVLAQHFPAGSIPAMLLNEGWAEAQSRDPDQLREAARWLRNLVIKIYPSASSDENTRFFASTVDPDGFRNLEQQVRATSPEAFHFLDVLTNDFWYGRDKQPVYSIGGAFTDFVIRRHGTRRFVELVLITRPGTFAAACRRVLGEDLEALERDFWLDVEQQRTGLSP